MNLYFYFLFCLVIHSFIHFCCIIFLRIQFIFLIIVFHTYIIPNKHTTLLNEKIYHFDNCHTHFPSPLFNWWTWISKLFFRKKLNFHFQFNFLEKILIIIINTDHFTELKVQFVKCFSSFFFSPSTNAFSFKFLIHYITHRHTSHASHNKFIGKLFFLLEKTAQKSHSFSFLLVLFWFFSILIPCDANI